MTGQEVRLQPGERVDDLLTQQLKIIQSDEVFSFSLDAVLLARFCSVPTRGAIVDLCSGNGVIPLLLTTRTSAKITGVEIQPRLADMAQRNVSLNGLEDRVRIELADLKSYHETAGYGAFDLVTVNPPYLPAASGDIKGNPYIAAARHELFATLSDVAGACAKLVKSGGKVAMVHRPSRLAEIISELRAVKLEPKRIRFVHPRLDQEANIVLVEAMKDGKPELRLLPPIVVHEKDGAYTEELKDIFYGRRSELQA
ncbi:tRNA1(Val) (adenine(37)-N6)-methyltransferase [Paenibacillus sp.]|uniref:tRNA1(Val) (adenine(37)-N6)-methyltransferase n=1 Tax=Paenibacillus sp. TaxID=58172 RepID=UPI002D50A714|nr:tRNA1(Val) (adenine(37)-N6)-methyltransferase [Paenibacillus sp.]HZG55822.1 tRNA1(Val) (adenine(37)-N6)-methyltransferase [Paenibacillus sp.]